MAGILHALRTKMFTRHFKQTTSNSQSHRLGS